MRKVAILIFQTLDGVMQAPSVPEENISGDFTQGGWARPFADYPQFEYAMIILYYATQNLRPKSAPFIVFATTERSSMHSFAPRMQPFLPDHQTHSSQLERDRVVTPDEAMSKRACLPAATRHAC